METTGRKPLSLYFHIPFCKKKCPYCHFFVLREEEKSKDRLLAGFLKELNLLKWEAYLPPISIYFGGGTPSLFGPERIRRVLNHIETLCGSIHSTVEITLEVNPDGIDKALADAFIAAGINRISIGVQSLEDVALKELGRTHTVKDAISTIEVFKKAGASQISIDLMYDRPHQKIDQWLTELKKLKTLPIDHVSLYNLTIEEGSAYKRHEKKIRALQPKEEESLKLHETALAMLEESGFHRYEVSAFGKNKAVSIHNLGYWQGREFYGLGPSAFSFIENRRYQNVLNFPLYLKKLEEDCLPIGFSEQLEPEASLREQLAIALRVTQGVDVDAFKNRLGSFSKALEESILGLIKQNYLEMSQGFLKLTPKGFLFYDEVGAMLI